MYLLDLQHCSPLHDVVVVVVDCMEALHACISVFVPAPSPARSRTRLVIALLCYDRE